MQWFMVRLFVELSFLGPLIEAFTGCSCFGDVLKTFESFDELKKRGLIAGLLIVLSAIVEFGIMVLRQVRRIRRFYRRHVTRAKIKANRQQLSNGRRIAASCGRGRVAVASPLLETEYEAAHQSHPPVDSTACG